MAHIFITGIGTDVGKSVVSAIVTEALKADYWKPIQSGDLDHSDTHKVLELISNSKKRQFHPCAYELNTPMSPHASAKIDGVKIDINKIKRPTTDNHLVIEGAGGLLVPLSKDANLADLITPSDKVILVSRHYLGSINHTLLSCEYLKSKNIEFAILFVGEEHPSTESIISKRNQAPVLGRVPIASILDKKIIKDQASILVSSLLKWIKK